MKGSAVHAAITANQPTHSIRSLIPRGMELADRPVRFRMRRVWTIYPRPVDQRGAEDYGTAQRCIFNFHVAGPGAPGWIAGVRAPSVS